MALINCPECGGTVSSFATACPHCGRPMDAAKKVSKAKTKTKVVPEVQPTPEPVMEYQPIEEPVAAPQVQVAPEVAPLQAQSLPTAGLSLGTIGKVMMIVFALVAIVFMAIMRVHAYEDFYSINGISLSQTFQDAAHGILYSLIALYFLVETFRPGRSIVQRVLGFLMAGMAMFVDIVPLLHREERDLFVANHSVSLVLGLFFMLYAATKIDWSKYVLLATGVMSLIADSYFYIGWDFMTETLPKQAFIALGSAFAACAFIMLVWWIKEAVSYNNKLSIRIPSLLVAMMIIAAVIVLAVKLNDIIDTTGMDYMQRLNAVKLPFIFILVAGLSSLLLSFVCFKNKFLFVISAIGVSISLFVLLGLDFEYSAHIRTNFPYVIRNMVNFSFAGVFLLLAYIIMSYVAEMTQGLTRKFSHKK